MESFVLIYTPQAMPIPENIGAGPTGQNRDRVRIPKQEELRAFWERVTDGLELQEVGRSKEGIPQELKCNQLHSCAERNMKPEYPCDNLVFGG
jgi:hypothetical protein